MSAVMGAESATTVEVFPGVGSAIGWRRSAPVDGGRRDTTALSEQRGRSIHREGRPGVPEVMSSVGSPDARFR